MPTDMWGEVEYLDITATLLSRNARVTTALQALVRVLVHV